MIILVTGSSGFIGKNIVQQMGSSFVVHEFDLTTNEGKVGSILDTLDKIKPDVILHVGACSDTLEKDVNYMMSLNYESTKIIMDWTKSNSKKMIYSSSAANYGENGKYPSNLYGWSKYVAEGYVISNGGIGLRYFNVYGPGEERKGRMSSVAYQSYIKNKNGENVKLFPGKPKRDFIYVRDVVSANLYAMQNYKDLSGDWYDIGSYEARTFEEVLECIGITDFTYTEESEIPMGYQFYTRAEKLMPGWSPKYPIEIGLKEYIKYLKNG